MYTFLKEILNENYDFILKVIQSISITLFFLQIEYNKYIAKIISFIGPLTFAVYLIHMNYIVVDNIINNIFNKDSINLDLTSTILLVSTKAAQIFVICCIIEYFRHILFTILRIRKICIYIERLIWKII